MADQNQINRSLPFPILFEDQHLLVLSKPAGLLSQGDSSGDTSLVDLLRVYFGRNYVGLVHRLDRNTSGLMVVAKRSKSAERLTEQLQKGHLIRHYHAILWGTLPLHQKVEWTHSLLKNETTNEVRVVPEGTPGSKWASLTVTPIQTVIHPSTKDPLTVCEFVLDTGRSHQIRVQCAKMSHPIIGDQKYGTAKSMTLFPRTALHSSYLEFEHPMSRDKMSFTLRYSADMIDVFKQSLNTN